MEPQIPSNTSSNHVEGPCAEDRWTFCPNNIEGPTKREHFSLSHEYSHLETLTCKQTSAVNFVEAWSLPRYTSICFQMFSRPSLRNSKGHQLAICRPNGSNQARDWPVTQNRWKKRVQRRERVGVREMYFLQEQLPAYTWPGSPTCTKTNRKIAIFRRVVVGVVVTF